MALALIGLILFLIAPFVIGPLMAALRIHEERSAAHVRPASPDSRFRPRQAPERRARRKLPPAA